MPTFMAQQNFYQQHTDVTVYSLSFVNSWLQEDPLNLRLGLYSYPASVEMPSLGKRRPYFSYPPGHILPVYLLFKTLDITGIVPDIYEKRGIQLLLLTVFNYFLHFLLALLLCCFSFFICLKLGFDRMNSTILAIIPAIVQFHNANSLYHHHLLYNMFQPVILAFALYIFLEFLRNFATSNRVLRAVRILQPIVMFYGALTDYLFVFVVLTVYVTRIISKEINMPTSLQKGLGWAKQSCLFFAPALAASLVYIYQLSSYHRAFSVGNLLAIFSSLLNKVRNRMGLDDGADHLIFHLKTAFITHPQNGFGLTGLLVICATFYAATRGRKFMDGQNSNIFLAAKMYLLLLIPSIAHNLFLLQHAGIHIFSSLKFSLALSLAFVLLPMLILQMTRKSHLLTLGGAINGKSISVAAVVGLSSSLLYGYAQIYDKQPITKMFSPPDYRPAIIGSFVAQNTSYQDAVFSDDGIPSDLYRYHGVYNWTRFHFSNKVIHHADNLDHVYHKTKAINEDFNVKILYYRHRKSEAKKLTKFLNSHGILVNDIHEEKIGGLLAFDGKKFLDWYERSEKAANKPAQHECNAYPQRCKGKG